MHGRRLLASLVVGLCAWTALGPARADPPTEAMEYFRRGRALYDQGRYREAIEEFERARALDPAAPMLVHNIAVVYEKLFDLDRALEYYQVYLRYRIDEEERERVEGVIRRLRGARGASPARLSPEPTPASEDSSRLMLAPPRLTPAESPARPLSGWFWASSIGAGAALLLGATTGVLALSADGEARGFVVGADGTLADRTQIADRARAFATVADLALLGTAILGVVALVLYLGET